MPVRTFTHEQSFQAVTRAIELQASGAPKAECDAAALEAIGIVRDSDSITIAQLTDQTIADNLDAILAQLQGQNDAPVGPPALPFPQHQLPAAQDNGDGDDIPF